MPERILHASGAVAVELVFRLGHDHSARSHRLLELRVDNGLQPFFVIAHRIKGAARIVSADILIKRCDALEQASLATLESRRSAVQQAMEALEVTLINELAKHA